MLSLDAVAELREAVRLGRRGLPVGDPRADGDARRGRRRRPLSSWHSTARELLLHGLLTASGWVVIAAGAGALWQLDLDGWGMVERYLPSTVGAWGRLRQATPLLILEIALLVAAGRPGLPAAVGGVVGDQALRVLADHPRRRAVPELRPADPRRPHHPAGTHPEADGVGRAADVAARPRHAHHRHGGVGGGEAPAAGRRRQPRAGADRPGGAGVGAGARSPSDRRRRGAGSRRAGLARRGPAGVPPAAARAARARHADRRGQLRCRAPLGDRHRPGRRRPLHRAGLGRGAVHGVRLVRRHAVLPQRDDDPPRQPGAGRPRPGRQPRALTVRSPLGHGRACASTPPAPRAAATRVHIRWLSTDVADALYARLRRAAR